MRPGLILHSPLFFSPPRPKPKKIYISSLERLVEKSKIGMVLVGGLVYYYARGGGSGCGFFLIFDFETVGFLISLS